MKKYIGFKTIIVVIVLLSCCYYYIKSSGSQKTAALKFEKVETGTFEILVSCTGVVSAISSVDVKSRVGGNVEVLNLAEGDYVKKNDLVAYIDKRNILLKVKQSETDLKSSKAMLEKAKLSYDIDKKSYNNEIQRSISNIELSKANLKLMQKGSRPEEIAQGQAQLDLSRANYENNRKSYERQKELFNKNLVSQSSLDSAKANLDVTLAQVKSAEEKLALLKQGYQSEEIQKAYSQYEVSLCSLDDAKVKLESLNLREQEIKNLEATVQKSEIIYQDAVEQLNDTTVLAPISGIVTQKWVDAGGIITSGISSVTSGTNIVTISDLSQVWIKANVDEADIHKLTETLEARVKLDAFAKRTFAAKLIKVGPRVYLKDNVPVIDVTLELLEGTSEVKVGMTADADIVVTSKSNTRMVPADSIIERNKKYFVRVATGEANGKSTVMKEIAVGESNGEKTILLDGLSDDDRFLAGESLKEVKQDQNKPGIPLLGSPPGGGRRNR